MEDPRVAKKLVKREVTRVVTPGTAIDSQLLRAKENNFLAAVARAGRAGRPGLRGSLDRRFSRHGVLRRRDALERSRARGTCFRQRDAAVCGRRRSPAGSPERTAALSTQTPLDDWVFGYDYALACYATISACTRSTDTVWRATRLRWRRPARFCTTCARRSGRRSTISIAPFSTTSSDSMVLDPVTRAQPGTDRAALRRSRGPRCSAVLDQTSTGMGSAPAAPGCCARHSTARRSKRGWMRSKSCGAKPSSRASCAASWAACRISSACSAKVTWTRRTPASLLALGKSLGDVPAARATFVGRLRPTRMRALREQLDELPEARDRHLTALADEPPDQSIADGGAIRAGYHAELDELRDLRPESGELSLPRSNRASATRTGIPSLKVRFNNIFGYYIEISKANLHLAPPDYERKQTLVNAERFTTPELKELGTQGARRRGAHPRDRARSFRGSCARSGGACPAHSRAPRPRGGARRARSLGDLAAERDYHRPGVFRRRRNADPAKAAIR